MFPLFSPATQTFAVACKTTLFGLEPWDQYLQVKAVGGNPCSIVFPTTGVEARGVHSPFLLIGLAILDDLIRVAALVAVGYVIYAGFQYMTSGGSPDKTKKAQNSIIDALVGLGIAVLAASIVAFIGNQLGG